MKHQNINVIENGIKITLNLGRQGDYNVRDIKFDMSDFQQKYGDGTATIVHYPANGSAYTVPSISGDSKDSAVLDSDNILTWTIGKLATRYDGKGIAEITWTTLEGLKKSVIYNTYCKESIGDYGADWTAQQSYIDQMVELASTIADLSVGFSDAERIAAEISYARENAASDIEASKNDAVNAVNTAKQTALTDIESAKHNAETDINAEILIAETHANNASQSATNASNSATNASNSADSASQSAASAQTSATNASNSAASASQYADNASSSANSAGQSATSAQTSATNASASEQSARQSAETAQDILDSVQAEGDTQINRVQSEGNTQISRVQAKGNEILNSLPSDFTQVQNDIAALNGRLVNLEEDLLQTNYTTTSGVIVNKNTGVFTENTTGNPSAISNIPVIGGASITLEFDRMLYGSPRGFAFYDANGDFIQGSGVGYANGVTLYTATVPANAVTMAFTTFASRTYKLSGISEVADVVKKANDAFVLAENGRYTRGINLTSLIKHDNQYINGTIGVEVAHNGYDVYEMICYPNTSLNIRSGINHNSVGYAVYDNNGNVLINSAYTESASNIYVIDFPNNSAILKFSASKSVTPAVWYIDTANDIYNALSYVNSDDTDNPYRKIDMAPSFITMFRKIACIGDSLTAGVINTTSPEATNSIVFKDFSYPSNMAKMTGVNVYNLGAGGATAAHTGERSWYGFMESGLRFPTADFTENPCDLYIIALGTNDISQIGTFTGTVDTTGVEDVTTSVGGYCEIIRAIKAYQPKAKIFVVTIPRDRNMAVTRAEANAKIKAIAEYYDDCYVIDLETYDIVDFSTYYKNGSHNNALGYNLRARQYIAYIDWIIENNLNDFRNVSYIGTNYDFTV